MNTIRLILASSFISILGCAKPEGSLADFTPYLQLQPGTIVKVVPFVEGVDSPPYVVTHALQRPDAIGTIVSITKERLTILQKGNPDEPRSFAPRAVKEVRLLNSDDLIWEWKDGRIRVLSMKANYDALLRIDRTPDGRTLVSFNTSVFAINGNQVSYAGPIIN